MTLPHFITDVREALRKGAHCYLHQQGQRTRVFNIKKQHGAVLVRVNTTGPLWATVTSADVVTVWALTPMEEQLTLGM